MTAADVATNAGEWPAAGLERVAVCPACGETSRRVLYTGLTDRSYRSAPGEWTLVACAECGAAYLDPRPTERTAPLAYQTYYDDAGGTGEPAPRRGLRRFRRAVRNGYLNHRYGYRLEPASRLGRVVVPLLPRYRELADEHVRHLRLPPGDATLLDVGCGEGAFLREMQMLGWTVEGIEPSADAAATCRAGGVPVREATLEGGLEGADAYDAITFRLVFEHIRNPRAALAGCRRALKPEGVLWIATPSLEAEAHRVFGRDWIHLEPPRHVVMYTVWSLGRLLAESGFEVIAVRPSRQARWSFRLSEALAQGRAPFERPPKLPRRRALQAWRADRRARRRPEAADVVVIVARAA